MANPLLGIPAAPLPKPPAPNPLMNIPAAPLERRGFSLGTTLREGVQDIGRIGLALPALGEQLVSSVLDVPEGSAPASDTLRDMAEAEASRRQMEAAGMAEASLPTRIGEGATRSAVGMAPGIALAPAVAAAGATPLVISAATAAPGALSTAGNQLGVDLNDPEMGAGRRLGRAGLQGLLELGGEMLPMGRLGLGPEARLAQAIAGRGVPVSAARLGGDVLANMGQEAITGGAQSVANDLTGTQPVTAGEVAGNAVEGAGMGAATALPLSAGMGAATHAIGALQERQAQLELQRQQGARQVADAFNPDRATNGALPADGPGPVSITPDVVEEVARHPEVTGAQAAEAIDQDQQAVADAVSPGEDIPERLGAELSLADEQVRAQKGLAQQEEAARRQRELASITDEALGEKPRDPPPEPPDLAAEAAKKTLADQERVQTENRERDRRKLAFALREDLGLVGDRMGGHFYDSAGKLQFNEEAPNRAARMGPERAKAFVQEVLGDDQGAMAGDDPTATPAAAKFRMEEKPLAPEQAAGVRTSSPPPAPTAAEIVALPPAQRMEAFRKLSPEVRAAIQPEISRLTQEQRHIHGFNDGAPAVPAAVPAKPPRRAKAPAAPVPAVPAAVPAASAQPVAPETGKPVSPAVAPEAPKPASAAVPSPNAATKAPAAPVADPKEVGRLARISKAVLPSSVAVTEHGDHVRITYPGGATIQVRPVANLPLDPAAWHDSVAKVKGALSGAFSRAGLGPLMPSKAGWLKLPKATQEKVMAELPPVAAVTDISGRRVGVSRDALVRLVSPGQRTDAQVADAIEEEDHHVLFAGLLTNEERTTVRDELARSRPELAKEDPASRVVMEAGYEHWRAWNQDRQRAVATPKTTGVFRKLAERIRTLLRWFDRTPTVPAKTAAQVWEKLGEVRERGAVTPAAGQADEAANASLIPRDESLDGDDLRKQWDKATGQRKPKGESWKQLEEKSAKIDMVRRLQGRSPDDVVTDKHGVPYRNGLVDFGDPRVVKITSEEGGFEKHVNEKIMDSGNERRMWRALERAQKRQEKDGPAYAVPQALNEILPHGQREAFSQWQKEADAILADPARVADLRSRAQADAGLSPADQVALRRLVSEQLSEATTSGNKNRWQEALETASLRKAAGARVARELAARRLDMSTPEGRREAILSYTAEMGSRWQNAYNKATTKRDRAAVVEKWQAQQERIHETLKKRFGIDLADPRMGEIFSDAYSVGRLFDAIGDAGGSKFSLGNLVGYYTAGNLLTAASFAVNLTGYPMMGAIAGLKGATQATAKHLLGMQGNRDLTSVQGAHAAARAGFAAIGRGLTNGALAFWTGRPQAEKQAKPISEDHNDLTRSASPIKNPFLRAATAPFLEANRFVDEMFWTIGYNGALAAAATEARMAGDTRSHREMIDNPDADLVERATQFADWLTLRTSDRSKLERGVAAIRSPTALEDVVDNIAPGMGKFTVNPLYFTMPFFSAIARLTVEGGKISPYGLIGNIALGAKRLHGAARADDKATSEKLTAQSVNNLAYALGGLALLGLALVPGGGDDKRKRDLVTGSPSNYKSAGERAINEAVEKPRTIGGLDYSRFDPVALPLALHADMRDALREVQAGKADWKTLRTLGEKAFNAAVERQFLTGLADLFKPQFDEHGDPKGVITKFGENVTGMLAPGRPWISSYRKATETQKMDRPRGDLARAYDAGTPSRDVFGEHEQTREDSAAGMIGSLFVTPKGKASPEGQQWQQRIHDLNAAVEDAGGKPWFPSNPGRSYTEAGKPVHWTDEQYDRVKEIAGAKWLAMLRQAKALDNPSLPPERQLQVIQALREQANQYAAGRVRTGH